MLEPFSSLFALRWSNPEPYFAPLPSNIVRTFLPASNGPRQPSRSLELLECRPTEIKGSTSNTSRERNSRDAPAILFLHGGFGSAAMYTDFMTYLAETYYAPTYALSLRGRGGSYPLSYLRLVFMTGLDELAADVALAVQHITSTTKGKETTAVDLSTNGGSKPKLIIVGHSSGGGLIQYCLAKQKLPSNTVSGIVLLDAIPNFGNISVYANWARLDPWFNLRMTLVHFNHVASPLSSNTLITNAFFGPRFASQDRERHRAGLAMRVTMFRQLMAPYESLIWPLSMMKGWWAWIRGRGGDWLRAQDVLEPLDWDQHATSREKICVMVGENDTLVDVPNQQRMVNEYRLGIKDLIRSKRIDFDPACCDDDDDDDGEDTHKTDSHDDAGSTSGVQVETRDGVRFVVVKGAGHHVQNDLMFEQAAEQVRRFALRV